MIPHLKDTYALSMNNRIYFYLFCRLYVKNQIRLYIKNYLIKTTTKSIYDKNKRESLVFVFVRTEYEDKHLHAVGLL